MKITKQLFFALVIFLALPRMTGAATLYFDPGAGEYGFGDTFAVDLKIDLDSSAECVNTVEGIVSFDKDYLEAVDFSTGDSILSLWIELPKTADMPAVNNEHRLKFSGGIPGGYCGSIPGDPGDSNILGKIIFKVKDFKTDSGLTPKAKISYLDTTRVLLNDGAGTPAALSLKEAEFSIKAASAKARSDWETLRAEDNIPPEPFILEIQQNPEVFDDQYYIIFSTTDKQTGVDHYEVMESEIEKPAGKKNFVDYLSDLFGRKKAEPVWQKTDARPYLLSDQTLSSNIKVKAVDKSGNERIAEYFPKEKPGARGFSSILLPVVVLLILVGILAAFFLARRRAKKISSQ